MLLPDNIKPEYSIYYVGSIIIEKLKNKTYSLLDLFQSLICCVSCQEKKAGKIIRQFTNSYILG